MERGSNILKIDNFNLACRRNRDDTTAGKGGGLLIYVKADLSAPEDVKPEFKQFNQCGCIRLPIRNGQFLSLVLFIVPTDCTRMLRRGSRRKLRQTTLFSRRCFAQCRNQRYLLVISTARTLIGTIPLAVRVAVFYSRRPMIIFMFSTLTSPP